MNRKTVRLMMAVFIFISVIALSACSGESSPTADSNVSLASIPDYSGQAYIEINNNVPQFAERDFKNESFENYSELDRLGRCGTAFANIGQDIMPTEKRGSIGQVKPSGWHTVKYDVVDGKYLYNRCHLIGYQLSAENANEKNLITGTRYLNMDGMLPFENMVADFVKETGKHVLYRVTPIYDGDDLLAKGVQMEAQSVEDRGEGIEFNVYAYNVQPGVTIDYATGNSFLTGEEETTKKAASQSNTVEIRGNTRSKIYHCPGQADYEEMADSKNLILFYSEDEALEAGYRKAKK